MLCLDGILLNTAWAELQRLHNVPVVVIFLVALLAACFQNHKLPFDDRLSIMVPRHGRQTIVYGAHLKTVAPASSWAWARDQRVGVAYTCCFPSYPCGSRSVLFVVSCFVSLSMGVRGTIRRPPIAVAVSSAIRLQPAAVRGQRHGRRHGFGDNLSFISIPPSRRLPEWGCAR